MSSYSNVNGSLTVPLPISSPLVATPHPSLAAYLQNRKLSPRKGNPKPKETPYLTSSSTPTSPRNPSPGPLQNHTSALSSDNENPTKLTMQATQATSPQPPSPTRQSPFEKALTLIDTAHAQDPTPYHPPPSPSNPNPPPIPYELHYANRMTAHLSRRAPSASERLQLAVRAQHFRRWEVPRSEYPMTRTGYHAWRTYLKKRQKEMVVRVCVEAGLGGEAEGVGRLVGKEGLGGAVRRGEGKGDEKGGVIGKGDGDQREEEEEEEEVRILEDVACLVFLDDQFEEFERGVEEEKMVGILRKTWGKMTARGRELALEIEMSERCRELAGKALAG